MPLDDLAYDSPVLVAVVPSPRDLTYIRAEQWYRIPVQRAPRMVSAEALAFYQTGVFGAERWAVRYIACIRQVRVVTRVELLPNEPGHPRAHERYYRFELEPLETLPLPVPSRRLRRLTFIATTYGQLLRARDVVELWRPEEHLALDDAVWGAGIAGRAVRR